MSSIEKASKWQRPKSVQLPTVWREYTGVKTMEDGKIPKFVIQDISEDMHQKVIEFMTAHFFRDEATCSSLKILEDPVSVKEVQQLWKETLQQNMGLVAFMVDDDGLPNQEIAGANVTGISYKDEHISLDQFQGHAMKVIVRDILNYACHIVDVFEHYGVEEYMTAMGLCVDPKFRGQKLGLEILKARFDLGKAVGLDVTMTAFTGMASQIQAERAGFELLTEVFYEDFKEEDGSPTYPNIKSKSCKIMAARLK